MSLTNTLGNLTHFFFLSEFFQVSGGDKTLILEVTKLKRFIKGAFTLYLLIGLMQNSLAWVVP